MHKAHILKSPSSPRVHARAVLVVVPERAVARRVLLHKAQIEQTEHVRQLKVLYAFRLPKVPVRTHQVALYQRLQHPAQRTAHCHPSLLRDSLTRQPVPVTAQHFYDTPVACIVSK